MILANYDDVSSSFLFGCVFIDCLAAKLSYGQRKVRLLFVDEFRRAKFFRLKVEYFPTSLLSQQPIRLQKTGGNIRE